MLKTTLLHPEILRVVASAGHGSTILIAAGNYPALDKRGPNAELVCLNLTPGIVTIAQVLKALIGTVPVETVNIMGMPPDDRYAHKGEPPVWEDFRQILAASGEDLLLDPIFKYDFFEKVESSEHVLTILTADEALFASLLITIGVRKKTA